MMILWSSLIFVILTFLFVYQYFTRKYAYWKKKGVPYAKPLPLVGNYLEVVTLRKTLAMKLSEIYRQFENVPFVGTFFMNSRQLVIRDPELIKLILVKDYKFFSEHALCSPDKSDAVLSNVLILMKNPKWKVIRAINGPLYTPGKIRNSFDAIEEATKSMIDYLEKNINELLNVKEVAARFTMEALSSCAYSFRAYSFDDEKFLYSEFGFKPYSTHFKYILYQYFYYLWPGIFNYYKLPFSDPFLSLSVVKLLWAVVEKRKLSNIKRNDAIDAVIEMQQNRDAEDNQYLDDDTIITQAAQYILAGFETTSSSMTYVLYELSLNPRVQGKLRKEIQEAELKFGNIDYHAITEMKYLDMVLSETVRKYPILATIDRRCVEDYTVPNSNLIIEKDCAVFIPLLGLHYDPKYFPDPNAFIPERFSEEQKRLIPSFAYVPFGDGPRNCIGQRLGLLILKVMLVRILSSFKLETTPDTPEPVIFQSKNFFLLPESAIPLKLTKI